MGDKLAASGLPTVLVLRFARRFLDILCSFKVLVQPRESNARFFVAESGYATTQGQSKPRRSSPSAGQLQMKQSFGTSQSWILGMERQSYSKCQVCIAAARVDVGDMNESRTGRQQVGAVRGLA